MAATGKEDGFAKTFISKANMQDSWEVPGARMILSGDELSSAIITTISKRKPYIANLQLLHTFHKHRGKGEASILCEDAVKYAYESGADYFRVSSEIPSIQFYEKIGFKFWGVQKSGCQLSMFRIGGPKISDAIYELDETIEKALFSKRKGCIVAELPLCEEARKRKSIL
ncbi:MAG: GNAT family N-acetyltransferase [Cyclobacteriaceae bacterium]